jgi:phospholipase D1/2
MCGDRDSEIAVVIKDSKTVASKMNGKDYSASSFAYELRIKLWLEHLGKTTNLLLFLKLKRLG